jgi:hypothetical protein
MDSDGDDELSFADFFSGLLPYFIYGDLKAQGSSQNEMEKSLLKSRRKSENKQLLNI